MLESDLRGVDATRVVALKGEDGGMLTEVATIRV